MAAATQMAPNSMGGTTKLVFFFFPDWPQDLALHVLDQDSALSPGDLESVTLAVLIHYVILY